MNRLTAHLPDTNNGEARTVPLSTTAVAVLYGLPRTLHGDVFPGITTEAVDEVIAVNPEKVAEATEDSKRAGWFVGQVMKATGGKANPKVLNQLASHN